MRTLAEKNLSVLRERFPALEEKFAGCCLGGGGYDTEILPSASGSLTLKVNNIFVHSARDPVREAERLVSCALNASDGTRGGAGGDGGAGAVVMLGFGLGYAAEAAAKLCPDSLIIIIENNPALFLTALGERDFSALFLTHRVTLLIEPSAGEIDISLNCAGVIRAVIENKALLSLAPRPEGRLSGVGATWESVRMAIDGWQRKGSVNTAGIRRFGLRWLRNLSGNLEAYCMNPGLSFLLNLARGWSGFPVFVCAAGPELDSLTPYLGGIYRRAVIVSVDTAAAFLTQNGVPPDFIVSGDPQYWNSRHLDYADFTRSILIAEPSVYPSIPGRAKEMFLCSSMLPQGRFFESFTGVKGALGSGGSVATSAWDFARQLVLACGGGGVVYTGALDLAYPGLKTHFKGAFFEEAALRTQNRFRTAAGASFIALRGGGLFYARAADGGRVLTDRRLSLYAYWFENRLQAEKGRVRTFSLSKRGLFISGADYCPPEALLKLKERRGEIDIQKAGILKEAARLRGRDAAGRRAAFAKAKAVFREEMLRLKLIAGGAETGGAGAFSGVRADIKESALFLVPGLKDFESAALKDCRDEIIKSIGLNLKLF